MTEISDEISHREGWRGRQYLAATLACLLGFCLGVDHGWTSPMQPLLTSPDPPVGEQPMTLEDVSWLSSVSFLGSLIGAFFWGFLADRLGRKSACLLVAVPHIISWLMIWFAQNFTWVLLARLVVGLGNSGATINVPVFVVEIAQDDLRGFLGCFFKIFQGAGVLVGYIVGTYFGYFGLALFGLSVPIVFLAAFSFLFESPVFLWRKGKVAKAEKSLLWYRNQNRLETRQALAGYTSVEKRSSKKAPFKSLFSSKGSRKALIIGVATVASRQICGFTTIISYAVNILQSSGTSASPFHSAIILACVQLLFSFFSSTSVERLGRRPLFSGCLFITGSCLLLLGTYLFFSSGQTQNNVLDWIPVLALSIHVAAYSVGLGPVAYVIKTEIFSPALRGTAMSTISVLSAFIHFGFIKIYPFLKTRCNLFGVFWIYGLATLLCAGFFWCYLPETKGRSQAEILALLNGEKITPVDPEEVDKLEKKDESV